MKIYNINKVGILEIEKILEVKCKPSYFEDLNSDSFLAWAIELEDHMNENERDGCPSDQIEIAPRITDSRHVEWLSVSEEGVDVKNIEWQVGHDNDASPAFGLDMFDLEEEAFDFAENLISEGKKNVSIFRFEDGSSVEELCIRHAEPIISDVVGCSFC